MTEQTECRWSWGKPDKRGQWWWGHDNKDEPNDQLRRIVDVTDPTSKVAGWWAYIGPIPPEPLPPKRKVVQTLYFVRSGWAGHGCAIACFEHWLSPDDTIPPGAIETTQKREVEQ